MLTDAVIKGLKPRGKQYKVGDQGGLYLLVKSNGSKLRRFKYYIEGIEKAPLAFGVYPEITLKRAREKQGEARKLLDQRIDPAVERREAKEAAQRAYTAAKIDTYSAIADEWFALYVEEMKHAGSSLSPDTMQKIEWLLNLAASRPGCSPRPERHAQRLCTSNLKQPFAANHHGIESARRHAIQQPASRVVREAPRARQRPRTGPRDRLGSPRGAVICEPYWLADHSRLMFPL